MVQDDLRLLLPSTRWRGESYISVVDGETFRLLCNLPVMMCKSLLSTIILPILRRSVQISEWAPALFARPSQTRAREVAESSAETHRPRPPSCDHHSCLRLAQPLRHSVPDEPSKGLPPAALGCVSLDDLSHRLQLFPNTAADLHPRADTDRARPCESLEFMPRRPTTCPDDEPAYGLY